MKLKMNDHIETRHGPGKIISVQVGKSEYFTVLHEDGQAAIYHITEIFNIHTDHTEKKSG